MKFIDLFCGIGGFHVALKKQGYRIYSPKGQAVTMMTQGGGMGRNTGLYKTETGIRRLSFLEAKRVMGFPDNHNLSKGQEGYKQLGNAVIPRMIEYIYNSIKGLI